MAAVALGYLAVAILIFFAADNVVLIGAPLAIVYFAIEFIRRPPRWRLDRAVRSLRGSFAGRSPSIVETRTMEWDRGTSTVYLVCHTDAEEAALRASLRSIRTDIENAAARWRVSPAYLSRMRLWALSRQLIDRQGGWFGFDHNVPFPDPQDAETGQHGEASA